MECQIEFDKQNTRKKRRFDVRHRRRADGSQPLWQKTPESPGLKLRLCIELGLGRYGRHTTARSRGGTGATADPNLQMPAAIPRIGRLNCVPPRRGFTLATLQNLPKCNISTASLLNMLSYECALIRFAGAMMICEL